MADVAALEKAAKDAAAKVREKETALNAAKGPSDSARQVSNAKKSVKLAEKTKWTAAKAAADKTAADGKAATQKTNQEKVSARIAWSKAKEVADKEFQDARVATTIANNAKAAADKAASAKAANAKDLAGKATYAKGVADKAQGVHKAAKAKEDAAKAVADKADAAHKAATDKEAADNKAAANKVNAAKAAYDKANAEYSAASSDWIRKSDARWAAYKALRDAEQTARTAGDTWAEAARKANIAQNVINATASGAKIIIGGVTGAASAALSAISNCSLLKGTKAGTAVDFSNSVVGLATTTLRDFLNNVGIDTVAGLASSIYCGKSVAQVTDAALSAAKNSAKAPFEEVVDKTMALLQAYDPDLTANDLKEFAMALKENGKAKK
jgi:hypothetical protein